MKLSERLRQQMLLKRALGKTNQEDQPVKKADMMESATKQG